MSLSLLCTALVQIFSLIPEVAERYHRSVKSAFVLPKFHISITACVNFNGNANGKGLNGHLIDYDSLLTIRISNSRDLSRLLVHLVR